MKPSGQPTMKPSAQPSAVPSAMPTSPPSKALQVYAKVAMEQTFTTTLTPSAFNADAAAKAAFEAVMEAKLGEDMVVTVTGASDGSSGGRRRMLSSSQDSLSLSLLPAAAREAYDWAVSRVSRRMTGTLVVDYDVTVQIEDASPASISAAVAAIATTVTASGFESDIGTNLVAAVPSLPTLTPAAVTAPTVHSVTTVITKSASPTSLPTAEATVGQIQYSTATYVIAFGCGFLAAALSYVHHHRAEAHKKWVRIYVYIYIHIYVCMFVSVSLLYP